MRYSFNKKQKPREGSTRTKSGFLFLPKCIGDEVRWLEFATWNEEYRKYYPLPVPGAGYSPGNYRLEWIAVEWCK